MKRLLEILGHFPKNEREGIELDLSDCWEVQPVKDACAFLRQLPGLVPSESVLYLESTTEACVKRFLEQRAAPEPVKVTAGTIWPRPDRHHMSLTEQSIADLVGLLERESVVLLCIHLHVYHERTMLLQWYDAFDDPLLLSAEIDVETVRRFCESLGTRYQRTSHAS